jgi:hypothetical protein
MKDPLYSRDVRQLLRDHKSSKAYFVVGFMTTEGAVWKRGSKQEHTTGVTVKAPVSLATGMPSQLDPGIAPSYTQSNAQEHAFAAPQTEIFAVAYNVVKLNRSFDKTAPNYVRSEPALGPAKRANPHHLAMGEIAMRRSRKKRMRQKRVKPSHLTKTHLQLTKLIPNHTSTLWKVIPETRRWHNVQLRPIYGCWIMGYFC